MPRSNWTFSRRVGATADYCAENRPTPAPRRCAADALAAMGMLARHREFSATVPRRRATSAAGSKDNARPGLIHTAEHLASLVQPDGSRPAPQRWATREMQHVATTGRNPSSPPCIATRPSALLVVQAVGAAADEMFCSTSASAAYSIAFAHAHAPRHGARLANRSSHCAATHPCRGLGEPCRNDCGGSAAATSGQRLYPSFGFCHLPHVESGRESGFVLVVSCSPRSQWPRGDPGLHPGAGQDRAQAGRTVVALNMLVGTPAGSTYSYEAARGHKRRDSKRCGTSDCRTG